MTSAEDERIRNNVEIVRTRMADAAERGNRPVEAVRLIAVTKTASREQIGALLSAGCCDLAESRPQQLWERAIWFPQAEWHLVGHLQRNKVDRTVPVVRWIHSIDNQRLLDVIGRRIPLVDSERIPKLHEPVASLPSAAADKLGAQGSSKRSLPLSVLLQVNISNEPTKQGWRPNDMPKVCESLRAYPHLPVRGLMGMASLHGTPASLRREFSSLRTLLEQLRSAGLVPLECHELSMGMSSDYEIAIEEGATMVRIGSALF